MMTVLLFKRIGTLQLLSYGIAVIMSNVRNLLFSQVASSCYLV